MANAKMTQAIREITVERGFDPRAFGLVAFGGAGPMHAVQVASELGIGTVIVPVAGGVLSAYGLLAADERYDRVRTHLVELSEADPDRIEAILQDLAEDALSDSSAAEPTVEHEADLRYAGQSFELTVPLDVPFDRETVSERFHAAHERTYGYRMDVAVELVNLRTTVRKERSLAETRYEGNGDSYRDTRPVDFDGDSYETEIHDRLALSANSTVSGPAVLEQAESTTVIPPEWSASVSEDGTLRIQRGDDGGTNT